MEFNLRIIKVEDKDLSYFQALNELSYRVIMESYYGGWDTELQLRNFEIKWREGGFRKVLVDGQMAGCIWVQELESHHEIRELQVHPTFQNKGIGSQILRATISRAIDAHKPLKLKVLTRNQAFNLYKRLGFVELGKVGNQYLMQYHG